MTHRTPLVPAGLLLVAAGLAQAQAPGSDPAPGERCRAPEYRQLDYSIGRFRVVAETGERAGELSVQPILSGCALRGHWRGFFGDLGCLLTPAGMLGRSTGSLPALPWLTLNGDMLKDCSPAMPGMTSNRVWWHRSTR